MVQLQQVKQEIIKRTNKLLSQQSPDGSWRYCFENPIVTDAYFVILLKSFEWNNEPLIHKLVDRIISRQDQDGLWRTYPDEHEGNLSSTIEAYAALIYSGLYQKGHQDLIRAEQFILKKGGLSNAGILTKVFFAFNGHYPWPITPIDPALLFQLPLQSPVNMYEISSYARAHFAPVMLALYKGLSIQSPNAPDLSYIIGNPGHELKWQEIVQYLTALPQMNRLLNPDYKKVEAYILEHIENDGTLLSYAMTTIFMIYGLSAYGYDRNSAVVQRALAGLISLLCPLKNTVHLQNSPSAVWDTSLIMYTLLSAGISPQNESLQKAASYLLGKQQVKYGDWTIHVPNVSPGGWGFSDSNTFHPDIDDTQAALRTMYFYYPYNKRYQFAYQKGVNWLLSMQNSDGGWAAFERNVDKYWIAKIPLENAKDALIDPSTADLTGRTLEFLGNYQKLSRENPQIRSAISWLKRNQETDGSWYGRWGVCYLYGTWAALTGLMACGLKTTDPYVYKAVNWIRSIQNIDGGWGESCSSDIKRAYVPLHASTPTQSAWALDALIAASGQPDEKINRGIDYLIHSPSSNYPTGAGLPGSFYARYHSYDKIWPLLALIHYDQKYAK